MRERPEDFDEAALPRVLAAEWGVAAVSVAHTPAGFGDHHWTAADEGGRRWFLTVADLPRKGYLGSGADAAYRGLTRAMDTAWSLANEAGLDFAVAPLRTGHGRTVHRLGDRYALSVFPFVDAPAGDFGETLSPADRGAVLDLLAALHRAAPPEGVPVAATVPASRAALAEAVRATGRPWQGGPFAEPARALLAEQWPALRGRLAEFDRRAGELAGAGPGPVVTHGEPHPGNVLRTGGRPLLIDWDTVGLAVPERDLWLVAETAEDLARYADAAGRVPDAGALEFYRLRWTLDDVAAFLADFRAPHARTRDTEFAWTCLTGTLASLTGIAIR
ncbi:phosphotransferase [Sphaerisporangium rufum]|nr:phosphotransferase [Sphaerisporangium rufum]